MKIRRIGRILTAAVCAAMALSVVACRPAEEAPVFTFVGEFEKQYGARERTESPWEDAGTGTTYYISSSLGDNANPGTDPEKPFQSFDALVGKKLNPGDNVLLRRGDVFSGAHFNPTGSGEAAEGKWITLDSYGSGELPILLGDGSEGAAISLSRCAGGYRIRNVKIDGYSQGIGCVRESAAKAFDGLIISDCVVQNVTVGWGPDAGDQDRLPGGAALDYGMYLVNVRNLTVERVTLDNNDCPIRFLGGSAVFRGLDVRNSNVQGLMIYGADGEIRYGKLMATEGNILIEDSRILGTGRRAAYFGSTGILLENTHDCTVKNTEIAYTVNTMGAYDACAVDWEQNNVNCTLDGVFAHDNAGPLLLAMEHQPTAGNSKGNRICNCLSVNNGLHGKNEVGTFLNLSSYAGEDQKIVIENCRDVSNPASSPISFQDKIAEMSRVPALEVKSFVSQALADSEDAGKAEYLSFAVNGSADATLFSDKKGKNAYRWEFRERNLKCYAVKNGQEFLLGEAALPEMTEAYRRIRVEADDGQIRTFCDEEPVCTVETELTREGITFVRGVDGAEIRNLSLIGDNTGTRAYENDRPSSSSIYPAPMAGDSFTPEKNWQAEGISLWKWVPYGAGWGSVDRKDASLTYRKGGSGQGANLLTFALVNGTDSGKVAVEVSKDGGATWVTKIIETDYRGAAACMGVPDPGFRYYTVDFSGEMGDQDAVDAIRLRFPDSTAGRVGLQDVFLWKKD